MPERIAFTWVRHLVCVPVEVTGAIRARFLLDTGIGVNLLSSKLRTRLAAPPLGRTHVGRRMSGQEVPVPLFRLSSLTLGRHHWEDVVVGELDLGTAAPELAGVDGFLSLGLFENLPFTVRARSQVVELDGRADGTAPSGTATDVPIRIERKGPEVTAFLSLALPHGERAEVEVDTGSDLLILHSRYLARLGIPEEGPTTRSFSGQDETGHRYVRRVARLPGAIHPIGAPGLAQVDAEAIFQEIIYDGLVGGSFLGRYDVSYDLAHSRLRFEPSQAPD